MANSNQQNEKANHDSQDDLEKDTLSDRDQDNIQKIKRDITTGKNMATHFLMTMNIMDQEVVLANGIVIIKSLIPRDMIFTKKRNIT